MDVTQRTAHTADLTPAELHVIRALLDTAFDGGFSDDDWDHTLGGVHALVHQGGDLVAHGSVVQRRVLHAGRSYRVGYVEGVAVRADQRRRGLGGLVMAPLERVIEGAYAFGALSASEQGAPLYRARGWRAWGGRIEALAPDGVVPLPEEEGTTYVLGPQVPSAASPLTFDWRDGDVL
ncbi:MULTISPECIES: GNAT family N-acetyltransferase [unclassified Streptomyces]|uniref:GNAT family N-acetyltransferase n=1 Tax=unclassified Streptomyces TaxID=2593676 RepID=UPI001E036BF7|nr:GNAT family N-acetyltransferase [Streptomyces sp. MAG02]